MAITDLYSIVQTAVGIFSWLWPHGPRPLSVNPRPVTVVALTRPDEPVFISALDLYTIRFPANQRDAIHDMIRWIQEGDKCRCNFLRPRDLLLAAVDGQQALALLNFSFYPTRRLAFLSYLATRPRLNQNQILGVSCGLIHAARGFFNRHLCTPVAIVTEVESPDVEGLSQKEKRRRLARIKRLVQLAATEGVVLRKLDLSYQSPNLRPELQGSVLPMTLLYGRLQGAPKDRISHREAKRLLEFVYLKVYGDSFDHDPTNNKHYRDYVKKLFDNAMAHIINKPTLYLTDPLSG